MKSETPTPALVNAVSRDVDVFPHVVVRIGGGSFDDLLELEIDRDGTLLQDLRRARSDRDTARSALGDEIFAAIGGRTDAGVRRVLLAAKRDLFNDRPIPAERLRSLPDVPLPGLSRYEDAAAAFDRAWKAFEAAFLDRQAQTRRMLQRLAASEAFQRPLMLASRTLSRELPAYLEAAPQSLSSKQLHIERTVIKYVTRAHAKTSPFSTFGRIALAELGTVEGSVWRFDESRTFTSRVRISSWNWVRLRGLILAITEIADHLRVRPNPTLETTEEGHKYLVNASNVESFRTLPALEELSQIAALTSDSPAFVTLLSRVSSADLVEGGENDVRTFLKKLISEGFLEFDAGISGTDPDWDVHLVSLLRPMEEQSAAAAEIISAFRDAQNLLRRFTTARLEDRDAVLKELHARIEALREFLVAAGHQGPKENGAEPAPVLETPPRRNAEFEQQHLLYEDSAISEPAVEISAQDVTPIVEALATAQRELSFWDGLYEERAQLTHYCVAKYGENSVPLTRVYEDFYRDCKVPQHRRKQERKTDSPEKAHEAAEPLEYPGSATLASATVERKRLYAAWMDAIVNRLREEGRASAERVDVRASDLAIASALLPDPEPRAVSGSAYVQLVAPSHRDPHYLGVVNGLAPGYGKMMSRFLDMFPKEVTESIREQNRAAARGSRLAEVQDGSVSNANMHPPLLDFEISSPGAQTSFPPEKQIPVSDLRVVIGPSVEIPLTLIRRSTGERVEILDLGFLGFTYRAPLLQLLLHGFSRANYVGYYHLIQAASNAAGVNVPVRPDSVISKPRVTFGDRIVLQRQGWAAGRETLPIRQPGESDGSFYLKVNDWRESHGIPEHVFVYLTRDRGPEKRKDTKLSRDDYKPQFISFQNWSTIDLFDRMRGRAHGSILLEEMLPSHESMLPVNGKRYVAELIVQWSPRLP